MTRTFCVGGEPTGELATVFEVVADAQSAGVAAVAPGVAAGDVDKVCRDRIAAGRLGRPVRTRHRPRGGPRHPRGAGGGRGIDCYPAARHRGHRRTRRVPSRCRWGPHRGHPGRDRHPAADRSPVSRRKSPSDVRLHQRSPQRHDPRTCPRACSTSSSSSTSSRARAVPSCAPSSRTSAPARSSSAPTGPTRSSSRPSSTSGRCSSSTATVGEYVFMDTRSYDQLQVETGLLGRRRQLPEGGRRRRPRVLRRRDRGRRAARGRGADHRRDGARTPGRPGVGCPQAGHPGDRPGHPGPPLRQSRRAGQGRHPHGRVPHPGLSPPGPDADRVRRPPPSTP